MIMLTNKIFKHTKQETPLNPTYFQRFSIKPKLCVVNCIDKYIKRRGNLVNSLA